MRKAVRFGVIAAVVLLGACSEKSPTSPDPAVTELPHSMKGYELYSWPAGGNTWTFALMTGTDRVKPAAEITSGPDVVSDGWVKLTVGGVQAVGALFRRMPQDERIHWMGKGALERHGVEPGPIELPPQSVIWMVVSYISDRNLTLAVTP